MKSSFLLLFCICSVAHLSADTAIWNGDVQANGTPTTPIKLTLGKKYQIKVSGTINLGKWWQQGKPLGEDACYEYNEFITPTKYESIKNSMNVPLQNDAYHPDHVYLSKPFLAAQDGIHFWIYDTDYSDNSGALQVQIIELEDK